MYPRININLDHYIHNINYLTNELRSLDELFVVTKVHGANKKIIDTLYEAGIKRFADSRLQNLKAIKENHADATTLQLRLPMLSEISELVKYVDRSLNSEMVTIKLIDEECQKINKTHEIILMIDVGDLREGIMFDSDYLAFVSEIIKFQHIKLVGIGFNVTCYGSVIPSLEIFEKIIEIRNDIEEKLQIKLPIISGGNSSSLEIALKDKLPQEINNLRIGDAFFSGMEAAYYTLIPQMHHDICELEAEIIEIKDKPSYPIGELGVNAFGEVVEYEDVGIHTRAILAIGRQDIALDDIINHNKDVKVLGSSSDHLIIEIKKGQYQVGDTIKFSLKYGGILSLFTSKYVSKHFI